MTIKPPVTNATLALSVVDTADAVTGNITALQTLAKAKTLTNVTFTAATPKPSLTITAAQLKANPELLATIKGDYDLTITGVAAADAVTVAGNADKVLKASGSGSTQAKVAITDTSANLVKNIAALELAATAGRLTSITVSDGKALVLTEAQIKADSHFLSTNFTNNATVEATAVAAADVLTVQSLVNANSKLTLTKESITDTAANIQANLDNLETTVKASSASSASNAFTIANIGITDKGSITVTNSTLVKDIDALKVLTGKYTLNVTDIAVSDALALKAPSKDATLAVSVKDTAANIAANWDKLQTAAKAKTLTSINVTDSASSLLSMTAAQLKSDADALKLVSGDYKLSVTGVAAADVTKTLTTKNIYSVEIKDTTANILKNLASIQTAVTAAKIQNVVITDAANPSLSISDIFALTTTLPNVTLGSGVKFNVKDTASNIIAHARDDIGDVLKNSGTVTITDKTPPNLTLADAITLKGITNLTAGTKYNVTDGGSVIATQAAITDETVLSGAASVTINKNFTISDAKAVTGIKTLAKGTVYSITDTADNILTQSAVSSDKILSGANTVTIVDTSANIIAKLDQLEVLAKAGKIADIKFTDTPSAALNITQDQLVKDAEAIGKIVSQRTLPTLSITKPTTPAPLPQLFDLNLPTGAYDLTIRGTILNGTKIWGQYTDKLGHDSAFISNLDGSNLVNMTPMDGWSISSNINGITKDNSRVWGSISTPYQTHAFISNIDGTNFAYAEYWNNTGSTINGITADNSKFWGGYSDNLWTQHPFVINVDGSNFIDLRPSIARYAQLNSATNDGSTAWGYFDDQNGNRHAFITRLDGTGYLDLTPPGGLYECTSDNVAMILGASLNSKLVWGKYTNQSGQKRIFVTNIDGTGFTDLTPSGSQNASIFGINADNTKLWGIYTDNNGNNRSFTSKLDGSNFNDLTPTGGISSIIDGVTPDGSKVWGSYTNQSGQNRIFVANLDGTGFTDLTPTGSIKASINGMNSDGTKVWGSFTNSKGDVRAFVSNLDASSFIDLTPPGANNLIVSGITPDGSKVWGGYQDNNGISHIFISNINGSNIADLANYSNVNYSNEGIVFGTYNTSDNKYKIVTIKL